MSNKTKLPDWLLLILPCLLLFGWGYFLRAKREEKFALIPDKVFLSPLTLAEQRQGYNTKITFTMKTQGKWPTWLTAHSLLETGWSMNADVFYKRKGRDVKFVWPKGTGQNGVDAATYDSRQQRYIAHCLLNTGGVPKALGRLDCHLKVTLYHMVEARSTTMAYRVAVAKTTVTIRG